MADDRTPLADLSEALYHMRATAGLKQVELAERSGVARAMISAYETGSKRPALESLERLLVGLESDADDLARALREVGRRKAGHDLSADDEEPDPQARLLLELDSALDHLQKGLEEYHRVVRKVLEQGTAPE